VNDRLQLTNDPITALTRLIGWIFVAAAALMLAACGGGGSPGDVHPGTDPAVVPGEPKAFLVFPNPQVQPDGSLQTTSPAYAQAYYAAIDPNNAKDTLAKWKAANNFDTGTGTQITVVFGDVRDLGFGRRITARQNADGTLAFFTENYLVKTGGAYAFSPINLEAAIVRDPNALVYVAGIEFSPGPAGGVSFAKYFNFNIATGVRENMADVDGRGDKAMPGPCIACHGGRADALMPSDASGKPRFNLLLNAVSGVRGDVLGQLPPFEVSTFQFSDKPGYTRTEQEPMLKTLNKWVLCSYPLSSPSTFPEDACRRAASSGEWQGAAAALIKAAYGGDGLPNLAYAEPAAPASWAAAGQTSLYETVVAPACRVCHLMRGTGRQSDIDFATYDKFQSYASRIFATVIDRGDMPLAKLVYDTFHASAGEPALADFLVSHGLPARGASGAVLRPGRPIADPGPDRVVRQGATQLSAGNSLFADTYAWSIVSGPGGAVPPRSATLTNANTAQPTFDATSDGTYVLSLVASNGSDRSAPRSLSLVVQNALRPDPSAIRFADIKAALQDGQECQGCHAPASPLHPPIAFTNYDRDGNGAIAPADDAWFYAEVRSRINFTEISASALLQKPAGQHHFGGLGKGFDASLAPGQPGRAKYDLFQNWILNGAPQ
jgi:mono/diheme cytochrome c family protein